MTDSEHTVRLTQEQRYRLANWLAHPNGACILDRATFESVEDGGILVRTKYYGPPEEGQRRRPERNMPGLADIMIQSLITVGRNGANRAEGLMAGDADDVAEAKVEALISRRLTNLAELIHDAIHS